MRNSLGLLAMLFRKKSLGIQVSVKDRIENAADAWAWGLRIVEQAPRFLMGCE